MVELVDLFRGRGCLVVEVGGGGRLLLLGPTEDSE